MASQGKSPLPRGLKINKNFIIHFYLWFRTEFFRFLKRPSGAISDAFVLINAKDTTLLAKIPPRRNSHFFWVTLYIYHVPIHAKNTLHAKIKLFVINTHFTMHFEGIKNQSKIINWKRSYFYNNKNDMEDIVWLGMIILNRKYS